MCDFKILHMSFKENSKVRYLILRIKIIVLGKNMPYCNLTHLVSCLTM